MIYIKTVKYEEYSSEKDCYEIVEKEVIGRYKYIGESDSFGCINGEIYDCVDKDEVGNISIVDETGEPYLYLLDDFELVDEEE